MAVTFDEESRGTAWDTIVQRFKTARVWRDPLSCKRVVVHREWVGGVLVRSNVFEHSHLR